MRSVPESRASARLKAKIPDFATKGGRGSQRAGPGLADTSLFSTVHDSGVRVPQSHQDSPLLYHKHSKAKGSSPPVWNCAHISLSKGLGVRGKQGCQPPPGPKALNDRDRAQPRPGTPPARRHQPRGTHREHVRDAAFPRGHRAAGTESVRRPSLPEHSAAPSSDFP